MSMKILNEQDYYRTVYGGWLGKNIGGTLGAPVEGQKRLLDLEFYPVLKNLPLENDDLDLQLVWLHALEQYGPGLTSRELGQEWLEHVFFPFDEYGYALTNLRRGLKPPLAGAFNNPFVNCMGSPIRSEIWAMVAPGAPHIAARYAYEDAVVDHAGGEGVYGEMFFAAIESAIFVEKDRDRLIEIGMSYIPESCRTAKALRDLLRWHREGKSWIEARELILEHHGHSNFTDAPQNIAFTILGWLYGESFEDAILKAVNCGYDTDCTGATLGAILGMIGGPEQLPERWVEPVGDRIVVSAAIKGFPAPKTLDELTKRTIRAGKQVLAYWDVNMIVHPELASDAGGSELPFDDSITELWNRDVRADRRILLNGSFAGIGLELHVDYGEGGPAIGRNESKNMTLTLVNHSEEEWEGTLQLQLPNGWQGGDEQPFKLAPGQSAAFDQSIQSTDTVQHVYELTAVISRLHDDSLWAALKETICLVPAAEWVIWGPESNEDEAGMQVSFSGNRLDWDQALNTQKDGVYRAKTMLHNPKTRKIRLIAASNGPVAMKLNGETIVDCSDALPFMPAYHRAPKSQRAELELAAGSHELEVTAVKQGDPLHVFVLPVSVQETKQPGSHYYHLDVLFYN